MSLSVYVYMHVCIYKHICVCTGDADIALRNLLNDTVASMIEGTYIENDELF